MMFGVLLCTVLRRCAACGPVWCCVMLCSVAWYCVYMCAVVRCCVANCGAFQCWGL